MMFVCVVLEREKVILDNDLFLRDSFCFFMCGSLSLQTYYFFFFMSLSHLFVLILNCILDVRCIKTYELFSHIVFHLIFSMDVVDEDEVLYGE